MYFKRLLDPSTAVYSYTNEKGVFLEVLHPAKSIHLDIERGFFRQKTDESRTYEGPSFRIKGNIITASEAEFVVNVDMDKLNRPIFNGSDKTSPLTVKQLYNFYNLVELDHVAKSIADRWLSAKKRNNPYFQTKPHNVSQIPIIAGNEQCDIVKIIYTITYCMIYYFVGDAKSEEACKLPNTILTNLKFLDNNYKELTPVQKAEIEEIITYLWEMVDTSAYNIVVVSESGKPLKRAISIAFSKLDDLYAMYNFITGNTDLTKTQINYIEEYLVPTIVREEPFLEVLRSIDESDVYEAIIAFTAKQELEKDEGKKFILSLILNSLKEHYERMNNFASKVTFDLTHYGRYHPRIGPNSDLRYYPLTVNDLITNYYDYNEDINIILRDYFKFFKEAMGGEDSGTHRDIIETYTNKYKKITLRLYYYKFSDGQITISPNTPSYEKIERFRQYNGWDKYILRKPVRLGVNDLSERMLAMADTDLITPLKVSRNLQSEGVEGWECITLELKINYYILSRMNVLTW